ncbi:hypothetical protein [Microbacterium sp.]|uniref:hypothetical protein n=1 Tax=Microbacterium sp. TaxID=51671 RepID=UPI003A920360
MSPMPQLGKRSSFGVIAATFALLTVGGTILTPLYTLWAEQLAFDTATTTWIVAVYVAGVLIALVCFGELSDQVGRRPLPIGL